MKRRHFFMVNAKIAHALKLCRFFIVYETNYYIHENVFNPIKGH